MSQDRVEGFREDQAKYGVPMELPEATAKPCSECPWRRKSAAGWLGPHPTEEWIMMAHGETPIMCHKTIKEDGDFDDTKQCRGAAIFRANVCKSPKRSDVATGPMDTDTVFADNDEFTAHHNKNRKFEKDGFTSGDRVRLLVENETCSEGEEGELEIEQVGSPLYMNLQLKMFFRPDGADEAIQEVRAEELEIA